MTFLGWGNRQFIMSAFSVTHRNYFLPINRSSSQKNACSHSSSSTSSGTNMFFRRTSLIPPTFTAITGFPSSTYLTKPREIPWLINFNRCFIVCASDSVMFPLDVLNKITTMSFPWEATERLPFQYAKPPLPRATQVTYPMRDILTRLLSDPFGSDGAAVFKPLWEN